MASIIGKLSLLALAVLLWSCQSGTVVNSGDTGAAPVIVTKVSDTALPGTVIYDESIPFAIGIKDATIGALSPNHRITGALQSRVIRAKGGTNLIFAYRFRDLVFTYPPTDPPQFIEFVKLDGFDKSFFPLEVFNIAPSQSLGDETWGPISTISPSGADPNAIYFHWASYFTKPGGTTWVEFLTKATKFKTGKYLFLSPSVSSGSNNNIDATLDRIAIPAK